MPIGVVVPQTLERQLYQTITEIVRKAVDGSNNPIQIAVQVNVTSNDIVVVTAGKGLVLTDDGGTARTCRVTATYDATSGSFNLNVNTIS